MWWVTYFRHWVIFLSSYSSLNVSVTVSNIHSNLTPATGTKYRDSEPVYPTLNTDWDAFFPDGTPVKNDKKPNYVFVWKTWGEWNCYLLFKPSRLSL